jgi:phosphoribosylformylglycinamidine cyclo-ligase
MSTRLYARSGVDTEAADRALSRLLLEIAPTQAFGAASEVGVGHFAAVIRVGPLRIALTTDGVGSKLLIAQQVARYDTIGIDCVAMNVNDLLCVGATPLAMLDYIAVESADPEVFAEIGRGLAEGAKQAGVSIVGGETAQIPEMLRGAVAGRGLDLVGMAIGVVAEGRLLDGSAVKPGDAVLGVASNGIHSNGLSLARRVLLHRFKL